MSQLTLPSAPNSRLDFTFTTPSSGTPDTLVIYVHGFASNQKGEKVQFFRERFNETSCAFLAFDHRGHGDSSGTMKELTITRNIEDLGAIVDSQGAPFRKVLLIGSSMGGQTAAWYAARHPDRIAANLLIAPGFRFLQNRLKDLGLTGLELLKTTGEYTVKNEWIEVAIGRELLEDAARYPIEHLLPDYTTPTLILHGTDDESVPFEDSAVFAKLSKARPLELFVIGGGDHRLAEYKETMFQEMRAFCRRHRIIS